MLTFNKMVDAVNHIHLIQFFDGVMSDLHEWIIFVQYQKVKNNGRVYEPYALLKNGSYAWIVDITSNGYRLKDSCLVTADQIKKIVPKIPSGK